MPQSKTYGCMQKYVEKSYAYTHSTENKKRPSLLGRFVII